MIVHEVRWTSGRSGCGKCAERPAWACGSSRAEALYVARVWCMAAWELDGAEARCPACGARPVAAVELADGLRVRMVLAHNARTGGMVYLAGGGGDGRRRRP